MLTPSNEFKGRVHAKMTVLFMFIHLCVIAKLCDFLSLNTFISEECASRSFPCKYKERRQELSRMQEHGSDSILLHFYIDTR